MEKINNVQRLSASCNKTYWILYQTVNLVNNKIYIGVHKTNTPYEFDGYLGCGAYINNAYTYEHPKTKFHCALKKYGVKNFKRTTLKVFDSEILAYAEEAKIVNEDFLKRSDVYNMILGGSTLCGTSYQGICQYSLDGAFIKEYESITTAAKQLDIKASSISDAQLNKLSYKNYYWSVDKVALLDLTKYHTIKIHKPIYMYNLNGEFLKEFPSTRSTGFSLASQAAILGNIVDKKYYFCFVKAESYSKARDIYTKERIIYLYDSSGKFLKEWNYLDALKMFPKDAINLAIRNKSLTSSGYYWGIAKYEIYNMPIKKAHRKIAKYTKDNILILIYNNSSECYAAEGKGVYKNLVGLRKTYKGFIYKYVE